MNNHLTTINLHGALGERVGREAWKFSVDTVGEAIRAIESQSKKLFAALIEYEKQNIKYRVLINGKDFVYDKDKGLETEDGIKSSELLIPRKDIETIDIIPVLEGAFDDIFAIVLGVVLIAIGVFTFGATTWLGAALIMGGLGMVAAGIANLLTPMPEFDDFREIEGGGRASYIFAGAENTVREGGPVYVGYGRLMVGSQVVQSSIDTYDVKNGNYKNTEQEVKANWGAEEYGVDYRTRYNTGSEISKDAELLIRERTKEWNASGGDPDDCDGTTQHNASAHTEYIQHDGDDYIIDRGDRSLSATVQEITDQIKGLEGEDKALVEETMRSLVADDKEVDPSDPNTP